MGKILIYGKGASGQAAANMLISQGEDVEFYEDEKIPPLVGAVTDRPQHNILNNVSQIIVSPSVPMNTSLLLEARLKNIEIIGETELAFRNTQAEIIAVTGTNGKTTTVLMLEHLLRACYVHAYALGNVGTPLSEMALSLGKSDVAVLEISSFQLETIKKFRPKIAVCLNVTPDHLERHGTFEEYAACKKAILKNMRDGDYAVLNADCPVASKFETSADTYYFSLEREVKGAYITQNNVYFCGERLFSVEDLRLRGAHNVANALAVIAVAKILKFPNFSVMKAISEFQPPRHRVEKIGKINGKTYFNDSKSTNPDSAKKAVLSMRGSTALIMGGFDKGLSYRKFFEELPPYVTDVIAFGANKESIFHDVPENAEFAFETAESLAAAVSAASDRRVVNVLFSPATSSFDMFKNYEARGDAFVEIVRGQMNG